MKTRSGAMGRVAAVTVAGLAACVPQTASYVTLPIVPFDEEAVELAVVEVRLRELAEELDNFQAQQLAFYTGGREPVPHYLQDVDGDGEADIAVVVIHVPADGARLTAVCPGPRAEGTIPSGGVAGRVVVKYEDAYR